LDKERQVSKKKGEAAYLYSGKCRKLSDKKVEENLKKDKEFTVRVRTDLVKRAEKVTVDDQIRGKVEVELKDVGDFIVVRSDGSPVLLLTATIDDIEMKINQAIRGEDMLNVTFRMWFIYRALKEEMPIYGHKPFIYAQDGKKLSKRHGATAIDEFKVEGYLSEAILNYLFMIGYSPKNGNKEIFSIEEMIEDFDWWHFQKGMPRFDYRKLDWYNAEYIRRMSDEELAGRLVGYLASVKTPRVDWRSDENEKLITQITPLVKERIVKLGDFLELAGFFFERQEVPKEGWKTDSLNHLKKAIVSLKEVREGDWKLKLLDKALVEAVERENFKTGDFFMSLRLAICGKKVTPPLTESVVILGPKETVKRLKGAIEVLEKKQ
jgi:glutamyl-tRNA synthetase